MVGFVKSNAQLVFGGFGSVGKGGFEQAVYSEFGGVKVLDLAGASFHRGRGADGRLGGDDTVGDGDGVGLGVKDGLDFEDGNAIAADIFGVPLGLFGRDEEVGLGRSGDGNIARDEKEESK